MIKFKYQSVVEEYDSFYVLGVGRKTGVSTRVDALNATAAVLNKTITVQSGSVLGTAERVPFEIPDVGLIIIVCDQFHYPELLTRSLRHRNYILVDIRIDSVLTEEYEQALEATQQRVLKVLAQQDDLIAAVVNADLSPEIPLSFDQVEALEDA